MIELHEVFKRYKNAGHTKVIMDHVTTKFETGHSYGILGVNGAGKSTTIRMLAGSEHPNGGQIKRQCRVSWPLGFLPGFHPAMSARNNITFAARAYGENPNRVLDFVEDFSELGDYIDAPVKTYSSGMMAKLGFALSMAIQFDCYLIDESTAVGDARFQKKCEEAFKGRLSRADIIMVSHGVGTIKAYCDRGAVLIDGKLMMFADIDQAIDVYNRLNR